MAKAAHWVVQRQPDSWLHLWVYEQNLAARRFYEHLHGEVTGSRIHNAPDGTAVPAVRYGWRTLSPLL